MRGPNSGCAQLNLVMAASCACHLDETVGWGLQSRKNAYFPIVLDAPCAVPFVEQPDFYPNDRQKKSFSLVGNVDVKMTSGTFGRDCT
jgi:hypothetical protein